MWEFILPHLNKVFHYSQQIVLYLFITLRLLTNVIIIRKGWDALTYILLSDKYVIIIIKIYIMYIKICPLPTSACTDIRIRWYDWLLGCVFLSEYSDTVSYSDSDNLIVLLH